MAETDEFRVIAGLGGALEYFGSADPRWSAPQALRVDKEAPGLQGAVLPFPKDEQPNPAYRPATLDEITGSFHPKEHQRVLQGKGDAGFFVVDALFRAPHRDSEPQLVELDTTLKITCDEMEVLGPWIRLTKDEHVSDAGENTLDTDAADGIDHVFATRYEWKIVESVAELLCHLLNFQQIKSGQAANRQGWSTEMDDVRLAVLSAHVMDRYDELKKAQPHTPGKWEQLVESTISGVGFGLGTAAAAAIVITPIAFIAIKVYKHGFGYVRELLSAGGKSAGAVWVWLKAALPKALVALKTLLTSEAGNLLLKRLITVLGPAAAGLIGNFVGEKILRRGVEYFSGSDGEDPDVTLFWYAWDQMGQEAWKSFIGEYPGRFFHWSMGTLHNSAIAVVSYASNDFEADVAECHQNIVEGLIRKSDDFGHQVTEKLLVAVRESVDAESQQIRWEQVATRMALFYKTKADFVKENYELLKTTTHRSFAGQKVSQLIAVDGRFTNRDALREYLKNTVAGQLNDTRSCEKSRDGDLAQIDNLLNGGGLPVSLEAVPEIVDPSGAEQNLLTAFAPQ